MVLNDLPAICIMGEDRGRNPFAVDYAAVGQFDPIGVSFAAISHMSHPGDCERRFAEGEAGYCIEFRSQVMLHVMREAAFRLAVFVNEGFLGPKMSLEGYKNS